jgi:hypothetical protein
VAVEEVGIAAAGEAGLLDDQLLHVCDGLAEFLAAAFEKLRGGGGKFSALFRSKR